jgi:hypothetical protein
MLLDVQKAVVLSALFDDRDEGQVFQIPLHSSSLVVN